MKISISALIIFAILAACQSTPATNESTQSTIPIAGTWKLISGTLIEKGDTTVTDYTKKQSFIKIINNTHFAFLLHDLNKGKDSAAVFSAGGGTYTLKDSTYTEHLEYCNDRQWEDHDFPFTVSIHNDTLIQKGVEKVENLGVERLNIEKYVRVKS